MYGVMQLKPGLRTSHRKITLGQIPRFSFLFPAIMVLTEDVQEAGVLAGIIDAI